MFSRLTAVGIQVGLLVTAMPTIGAQSASTEVTCVEGTRQILADGITPQAASDLKELSESLVCASNPAIADQHRLFTAVIATLATNDAVELLAYAESTAACIPAPAIGEICTEAVLGDTCPVTPIVGDISISVTVLGAATDVNPALVSSRSTE